MVIDTQLVVAAVVARAKCAYACARGLFDRVPWYSVSIGVAACGVFAGSLAVALALLAPSRVTPLTDSDIAITTVDEPQHYPRIVLAGLLYADEHARYADAPCVANVKTKLTPITHKKPVSRHAKPKRTD